MDPVRLLTSSSISFSLEIDPSSVGMIPLKLLRPSLTFSNEVNSPNSDGISPESSFVPANIEKDYDINVNVF